MFVATSVPMFTQEGTFLVLSLLVALVVLFRLLVLLTRGNPIEALNPNGHRVGCRCGRCWLSTFYAQLEDAERSGDGFLESLSRGPRTFSGF